MSLEIQPFGPAHVRENFLCGKVPLDEYLKKQLSQDIKKRVTKAYVLIDTPNLDVLGYYTISSSIINLADIDKDSTKKLPRYPSLPAMLIGRLARHQDYIGKRYGNILLLDSLKKILNLSNNDVGICAVVVDVLDKDALKFYGNFRFQAFQSNPMKLYLLVSDLKDIDLG